MRERNATKRTSIALSLVAAGLILGLIALPARGQQSPYDPAGALVAEDLIGRQWLEAKGASRAKDLTLSERLRALMPWAERYYVPLVEPLKEMTQGPGATADSASTQAALAELEEAIDDAVRRSVAAKGWKPMGELTSWEAFLGSQGFKLSEDGPSQYILGARHRLYRRPPRLPQAIHTVSLTTRGDKPSAVFGATLRYSYPPKVADEILSLERQGGRYEESLALRLPSFQADRPLLEALGEQALGGTWGAHREAWGDFISRITDDASIPSRAKVLKEKNPPTISEVLIMGEIAVNLYEFGPSGRLELLPQGNALDLRGNPLYGARPPDR